MLPIKLIKNIGHKRYGVAVGNWIYFLIDHFMKKSVGSKILTIDAIIKVNKVAHLNLELNTHYKK